MGKLGKKTRKFAKKHLPSVLKQRRKFKSIVKRKSSSKNPLGGVKDKADELVLPNGSIRDLDDSWSISLDSVFNEDVSDVDEDTSDNDGYLSEGSSCLPIVDAEGETALEDKNYSSVLSEQNSEVYFELAKQKEKLDKLKKKDPKFSDFLEKYGEEFESYGNEEKDSDEDEPREHGVLSKTIDNSSFGRAKFLTDSCVKSWIQLATEHNDLSAFSKLLNGYWTACHHGNILVGGNNTLPSWRFQNSDAFCNIILYMLHNADNVFRVKLGIICNNLKKSMIMDLVRTSSWDLVKPLIKSYLKSTLVLLNQVTVPEILNFVLARLRTSLLFFTAFPSLQQRLIKVSVHLWATGQGTISYYSFLIIKDMANFSSSDFFIICVIKSYRAIIQHCSIVKPENIQHLKFLRDSFVVLCSMDVHKSISKVLLSIQQLAKILQLGIQTKKKEILKVICSWQYINCIDLWVAFISLNIREYDLQGLLNLVIQIINGVANLFCGLRYLPLRLKCIQWLNSLSSCSGLFIPVSSFVLDMLEYRFVKENGGHVKSFDFLCTLKLPKQCLKSQNLQEECVVRAIELLSVHFAQWSYHISFPELATIPLMSMKQSYERTKVESLRRVMKHFIEQVEHNVDFVQKKRDDVAFSPKDRQLCESFLQLEKCSSNASFSQYYRSVFEKASSRDMAVAMIKKEMKQP